MFIDIGKLDKSSWVIKESLLGLNAYAMPLEACMLVIDNSEYMRNGDYAPNRFDAQSDAVSVVFGHKADSNPENTAGVMTMAGKGPEVLVTPTQDVGKILSALHATRLAGSIDLVTAIQVAQLALKHRQNKNLRQRIIAFVGSPLDDSVDEKSLVKVGKKLKKNNVALDIVSFGEHDVNEVRLKALVDAVQSGENSHFLTIDPGSHLMSDIILTSPILRDPSEAAPPGAAPNEGFEFGFDPSLDPELAMALRLSAAEEQARQQAAVAAAGAGAESSSAPAAAVTTAVAAAGVAAAVAVDTAMEGADADEEALLAQALALSEEEAGEYGDGDVEMGGEDISEEEAIERAIAMSMARGEKGENDEDDEDMQPAR